MDSHANLPDDSELQALWPDEIKPINVARRMIALRHRSANELQDILADDNAPNTTAIAAAYLIAVR